VAGCDRGAAEYATHPVVSATVAHFAPNVELGGGIERMSVHFRNRRWIPGVGAVTDSKHERFVQLRFFPDDDALASGEVDWTAPLRSMELVSVRAADRERTLSEIATVFGASPAEGCVAPADTTLPLRAVQYWVAPDSAGGLAVISDFMQQGVALIDSASWSPWAWSGAFRGSDSFVAPFDAAPCSPVSRSRAKAASRTMPALRTLDGAIRRP
jgi:hypothetical protein